MAVLDLEGRELQDFSLFDIYIDMGENHLIHLRQAKTELPNDAKCLALNAHEMQDGGNFFGFVLSRSQKTIRCKDRLNALEREWENK